MKIGILEAGLLRDKMAGRFDPYPKMFERFLQRSGRPLEYHSCSVVRGEMPSSISACDGWLITGSRHGVYDELDWIPGVEDFIRELAAAGTPLIGVCFGHQIIAQALGGEVVKSDRGWGVGLHRYRIDAAQPWMREQPRSVAIHAFHQDQVIKLPPTAEVLLSSEFCPLAGLTYGDSIISVQAHPEFDHEYELALLEAYGGSVVPADVTEDAYASMRDGQQPDTQILADWFVDFFLSRQSIAAASNA